MTGRERMALRPRRDGGPVRALRDRGLVFAALVTGYVVVCGAWFVVLVVTALDAPDRSAARDALVGAVADQAPLLVGALVLATVGLFLLLGRGVGRYVLGVRRLAADVRLATGANPAHRARVEGPGELRELAADVNALAEARQRAGDAVAALVAAAAADVEAERSRLAALRAELDAAVVVTRPDGRVQLYNAAARALAGDPEALALGRGVDALLDPDVLTHAVERLRAASPAQDGAGPVRVASPRPDGRVLRASVAGVRAGDGDLVGLVVVLDDLTALALAEQERDRFLRDASRATRSHVANIRAAIETVLDYPDMDAAERDRFLRVVEAEARELGDRAQEWFAGRSTATAASLPADMSAEDLLTVLAGQVRRAGLDAEVLVAADARPPQAVWLRVDSHALGRAVTALASWAVRDCDASGFELAYDERRGHAAIDLRWSGEPAGLGTFTAWLAAPLDGTGAGPTLHDVVDRHGGEVWAAVGDDDVPYVRMLLPRAGATREPGRGGGRRAVYDFGLLEAPETAADLRDVPLAELAFTVFDTETTGLDAAGGDEIVQIAAVRCLNGRVVDGEEFDALVHPGRRIPAASTAVHGITEAMVAGAPPLADVVPRFARFADGSVLVGHNVAFDLQFLRLAEGRTGVALRQPVLDTLMLDAAVHPDHPEHTLEAMAARLGVEVTDRHTALGDARVTAQVFLGLVRLLADHGITTLGEAVDASRATYMARVDRRYA